MPTPTAAVVERLGAVLAPLAAHLDVDAVLTWAASADDVLVGKLVAYAGEARFFEQVLSPELDRLRPGATVLEIGAGTGLLTRLVAGRGHDVIAFEPASAGFGAMRTLGDVIASAWRAGADDGAVTWRAEPFVPGAVPDGSSDLAYAVNVIEHVPDPAALVAAATAALAPGGVARFVCPNYAFPYEPHFGLPTLFAKRPTHRVWRGRIAASTVIDDPEGFWAELSWPTAVGLARALRHRGVRHELRRSALHAYLDRLTDPTFLARKGAGFRALAGALRRPTSLAVRLVPTAIAPIIDLTTEPGPA